MSGDGFNDGRLRDLRAAIAGDGTHRVVFLTALLEELLDGISVAQNDEERERYGWQAVIVVGALTSAKSAQVIEALVSRIDND